MSSIQTECSGSDSEMHSDEQYEALNESLIGRNESPDVMTSKDAANAGDVGDLLIVNAESPEVTSNTIINKNGIFSEKDENEAGGDMESVKNGDVTDGFRNISEKLSAALLHVSPKEDLVKQHAKVAEEALAGWEKAENKVASLMKQLEALTLRSSALEDKVTHLDGALKECVRQLRQTREEQEQNIHDAVIRKTQDLESAKIELENQLIQVQSKLEGSNARSPSSVDLDMCRKVETLEKENIALRHKLLVQSEELEIRTIERDLSTQAAETASKQHLESINKVAKLEAECRRLKSMACRASTVNDHKSITASSICVESFTDSLSDNGERLNAVESRKSGSEPDKCEPSCSDSWASALIAELDQFKNDKCRQIPSTSVKIDLMDDFLEMERLAALPETMNKSFIDESVVTNQNINGEFSLREDNMSRQMHELTEKLEKAKADKSELEKALMKSEECIEASQLKLREAEAKLEELQRELDSTNKSEQMIENQLMSMEAEAQSITAKVHLLEADLDKERAISVEIELKYKELKEELESAKQEEKIWSMANSYSDMKIKQEDLVLAAGKLAECQQTIASLGNQLSSLATLEAVAEVTKLHSNGTIT